MEKFLEENGLLEEATEYVENSLLDLEELPFDGAKQDLTIRLSRKKTGS